MINPEVKSFTLAQEQRLFDSLPKPLEEYPPQIQVYIKLAALQKCEPEIQISLVTTAVMVYGIRQLFRSNYRQRDMAVLTIEDAAQILHIPEDLARSHYDLVIHTNPSVWDGFESDLQSLKVPRKKPGPKRAVETKIPDKPDSKMAA